MSMLETLNTLQNTIKGNDNSQIGLQYNHEEHYHHGLSVTEATTMAFAIFREYYPALKDEALCEVRELVEQELGRIPQENIIPPSPRVALPALQSASMTEDEKIREMYSSLLACSMNKDLHDEVHPAFVKIIDQLSVSDALLFKKVHEISDSIPVARITFVFGHQYLTSVFPHFYSPYFDELGDIWATSMSIENLSRLQIINLFEGNITSYDYSQFRTNAIVQERFEFAKRYNPSRDLKISVSAYVIQQSDFGKRFAKICLPGRKDNH